MYVKRSRKQSKGIVKEDLSSEFAFLTKLASDGLLKSGTGALPRLVFDERDFQALETCKIGKI